MMRNHTVRDFVMRDKIITSGLLITLTLYVFFMVIMPFYDGGFHQALKVWEKWQTFNSGMIALVAAIITAYTAVYIDKQARQRDNKNREDEERRYKDTKATEKRKHDEQREREFIAAKAFLPHVLADIDTYAKICTKTLFPLLSGVEFKHRVTNEKIKELNEHFQSINPPQNFEKVFQDCIKFGNEYESKKISKLLLDFQVFNSRMKGFKDNDDQSEYSTNYMTEMLVYTIYFQLKVIGFYDFAREGKPITEPTSQNYIYYCRLQSLENNFFSDYLEEGKYPELDKKINMYCGLNNKSEKQFEELAEVE
ncbi:hypothetical protein [Photobacterium piscicola]|uniref:hypothetical protein n=1 Tax=Photobacterium piscicola TaxID=1378299 RepID=UPI0037366951